MTPKLFPLIFVLPILLFACSNPADNVTEAQVGNAEPVDASMDSEENTDATTYTITSDSTISFIGSKVTGSHDGGFKQFEGAIQVPNGSPEGTTGKVVIDMNSLWSDNERLTGHLKSADFFEVETYPTSTFTANKIEKSDEGYTVSGSLNLHGVTKSISFPAQIDVNGDQFTMQAEFFINRFDFGIKYPGKPDDLIRKEVVIKLDIKAQA